MGRSDLPLAGPGTRQRWERTPRKRRVSRTLCGGVALVVASVATPGWTARPRTAQPPASGSDPPTRPRDPNTLPPLPSPYGQPRHAAHRRSLPTTGSHSQRRHVQLTVSPAYASLRLPLRGRDESQPIRGGGIALEGDVLLLRPLWLRLLGSHSVHRVDDVFERDDNDSLVQTAAAGLVQVTHAGASVVLAMDYGRIMPLIDAGIGAMWIRSPEAVQDGQFGGQCLAERACDAGLVCAADNTCRVGLTPEVHAGLGVDLQLGDRWSLGAQLRYFALLSQPATFPIYLTGTIRLGLRF